jgi:hypothetical protein
MHPLILGPWVYQSAYIGANQRQTLVAALALCGKGFWFISVNQFNQRHQW